MSKSRSSRKLALSTHLTHLTAALLNTTDSTLLRLSHILSTPNGIDTTLCTLSYTLLLLSSRSQQSLDAHLRRLASSIATKASQALLPGEAIIASWPADKRVARLARRAEWTRKVSELVGDFRIFVRLWGLVGVYTWARDTFTSPPKDAVIRILAWGEIWSMFLFQIYENGAYLASKGILQGSKWQGQAGKKREARWWIISSRWWAAQVFLHLLSLAYRYQLKAAEPRGRDCVEEYERDQAARKWRATWAKEVLVHVCWAPMTLHWSVEEGSGFLSDGWVGMLGMVAGGTGLAKLWRQAALKLEEDGKQIDIPVTPAPVSGGSEKAPGE